ncbi:MAG: plasmid partitioning protein RepB C-terminal domain-containing protein [Alphaproteobacteria bacterium]|nr:plasmid partitioning protein RepB C-terminal domain-containing protein [Alphaproteobacteria bacterium]
MPKKTPPLEGLPQTQIKAGFKDATVSIEIDQIMPVKIVTPSMHKGHKYLQILASIQSIGIIEPPVVIRDAKNSYILLDGHMRIEALKDIGEKTVTCLVSTDDEAFTYNKYINRLSTIQEHKMILRAIERGVSEKKIAEALNLDVKQIIAKRDLLNGICAEAAELLKDKIVSTVAFQVLRRMKDLRQIEAVNLMNDAGNYSKLFARALLAATPKSQLVDPEKPKNIKGLDSEQMARMESEMDSLQREYQLIVETFGKDVLELTIVKTWLVSLLKNTKIEKYLSRHHVEFLTQFQKIAELETINAKEAT